MIEYLAFLLLLAIILGYIKLVYKPRQKLLWYKNVFEGLGYKVKTQQFRLFKVAFISQLQLYQKKYGDIFYLLKQQDIIDCDIILTNAMTNIQIILINPQLIKSWLIPENVNKYYKYPLFAQNMIRVAGGPGLLLSEGQNWKKKRKITTKVFNHQLLTRNIPKINQIFHQVFDQLQNEWSKKHPQRKNEIDVNIGDVFAHMFSKVMLQIFFGTKAKKVEVNGEDLGKFFLNLFADINKQSFQSAAGFILGRWIHNLGITAFDRSINERIKITRNIAKQIINQQIQHIKLHGFRQVSTSIIEVLLKKQFEENQDKDFMNRFDPDLLIEDFNIFFIAGTDTTTNLMKGIIYNLGLHPQIFNKLRLQTFKHIKQQSDTLEWDKLKSLEYIDWIQNQMIRICGPVPNTMLRVAKQDNFISNIPIKKGDLVHYFSVSSHFNSKFYKNPQQFRPERWQQECKQIHPFAFLGFSSGPRSCIGKNLALLQSKLAIIKFVQRFKQIKMNKCELKTCFKFTFEIIDFPITLVKNV